MAEDTSKRSFEGSRGRLAKRTCIEEPVQFFSEYSTKSFSVTSANSSQKNPFNHNLRTMKPRFIMSQITSPTTITTTSLMMSLPTL